MNGPVANMNMIVASHNSLRIGCIKYTETNDKNQNEGSKRWIWVRRSSQYCLLVDFISDHCLLFVYHLNIYSLFLQAVVCFHEMNKSKRFAQKNFDYIQNANAFQILTCFLFCFAIRTLSLDFDYIIPFSKWHFG